MQSIAIRLPLYLHVDDWRKPYRVGLLLYQPLKSTETRNRTASTPQASCTGKEYTVGSKDTCESISQANSIAIDWLISSNGLDYDCSSLKAGTKLCLGLKCALYTVKEGQTCQDITANKRFTSVQLASWNP